jgi:hypothetical protein
VHTDLNTVEGRLSALGGFDPPAAGWAGVEAARRRRESRIGAGMPAALAALLLASVATLAAWHQAARRASADAAVAEAATVEASAVEAARIAIAAEARAENVRLESILAALPERHAMRGSTAFTVAELEDRLVLLDDRLSRVALEPNAPERSERLWRERVDVMQSLVQVRYADAVGSY